MLFKAFCTPIYGCSLWCCMFQYSLNKLRVAYNDAFRLLLNEPRWCSASRLFVLHNVPLFWAIIHKSIYSLWCNLKNCDTLCRLSLLSDLCMRSPHFYSARNARIASAVLATAIPSVCLSVRPTHAGIVSKRRHVAWYSLQCQIAKCI